MTCIRYSHNTTAHDCRDIPETHIIPHYSNTRGHVSLSQDGMMYMHTRMSARCTLHVTKVTHIKTDGIIVEVTFISSHLPWFYYLLLQYGRVGTMTCIRYSHNTTAHDCRDIPETHIIPHYSNTRGHVSLSQDGMMYMHTRMSARCTLHVTKVTHIKTDGIIVEVTFISSHLPWFGKWLGDNWWKTFQNLLSCRCHRTNSQAK